jgi:hypothetical protein
MRSHEESCGVMQSHAESCGAMRSHAESCRVMRSHAESCGVMHNHRKSHRVTVTVIRSHTWHAKSSRVTQSRGITEITWKSQKSLHLSESENIHVMSCQMSRMHLLAMVYLFLFVISRKIFPLPKNITKVIPEKTSGIRQYVWTANKARFI